MSDIEDLREESLELGRREGVLWAVGQLIDRVPPDLLGRLLADFDSADFPAFGQSPTIAEVVLARLNRQTTRMAFRCGDGAVQVIEGSKS